MRLFVFIAVAAVATISVATASAHSTRWSWTESFAETRVSQVVRIPVPQQVIYDLEGEYANAKSRYENCLRPLGPDWPGQTRCDEYETGYAEVEMEIAADNLAAAKRGYKVVPGTAGCIGSGPATKGYYFKHFRCTAVVGLTGDIAGRVRLYVHVMGKKTLAYQRI